MYPRTLLPKAFLASLQELTSLADFRCTSPHRMIFDNCSIKSSGFTAAIARERLTKAGKSRGERSGPLDGSALAKLCACSRGYHFRVHSQPPQHLAPGAWLAPSDIENWAAKPLRFRTKNQQFSKLLLSLHFSRARCCPDRTSQVQVFIEKWLMETLGFQRIFCQNSWWCSGLSSPINSWRRSLC